MLHYGCYVKKLDDIESIGVTLTNLKEIADEVLIKITCFSLLIKVHLTQLVYQYIYIIMLQLKNIRN